MGTAEANHEVGREGVFRVKAWLEATTHLTMPWNVYDHTAVCTRERLDGGVKRYDLSGQFIGENQRPAVVEVKAYTTVGGQAAEYTEFLANAYSTTAHEIATVGDTKTEFIWVTTHPFSQTKWAQLTTRAELAAAVDTHRAWLGENHEVDQDLLVTVASRLWLLVRHDRQSEISLTTAELFKIYEHIGRYPS
jgi:hypothetical protein